MLGSEKYGVSNEEGQGEKEELRLWVVSRLTINESPNNDTNNKTSRLPSKSCSGGDFHHVYSLSFVVLFCRT